MLPGASLCTHKRGIGRMSALGANRTRRDGGNDAIDPERSLGRTDRAMEAWYHPSIA